MDIKQEETIEYYKQMSILPNGIAREKAPHQAKIEMNDAELMAFYSEQYLNVDVADFLTKERRERLFGLCDMVQTGEFCLDVGCANGAHMDILYQRGISTIGLDLSISNILRGRARYPYLKFIHGFAEEIPFKDNYFDLVLLGDVIEHFRNPTVTLAECFRVSRKGLALCVPIKEEITAEHINPFSYQNILGLLQFFKLQLTFFNWEGEQISDKEAQLLLGKFPWLLVRAEKTSKSDARVKEVIMTEGKKLQNKASAEILNNDQWLHDTEHKRAEHEIKRFKYLSNLLEGEKILEIGCGNGDLSLEIAKNGFNIVGIDISQAGIAQANEIAQREHLDGKANFSVMDATNLDFPDNCFDSVIIPEVFEHIRDSRKILEEALRVVRNGGRIVISLPQGFSVPYEGHIRVFFKDTLENELSQYTENIEWHQIPENRWMVCSFFVKKIDPEIINGPAVDILMPTYNGRRYIRNAIRSVLNQSYSNWNLVIVNDGGEPIEDILNEFQDNRIKYINIEHKGKAAALNIGIQNSNGDLIAYFDDDDILYPLHIEILVKAILEQNIDLAYSDCYLVSLDENDKEIGRQFEYRTDIHPAMLINQNYINHKNILHKRSLFKKTGLYDEDLEILIDWDMIRRLFFASNPYHTWHVTSEHMVYYKEGNISNRISGLWGRDPEKCRQSLKKIINKIQELPATEQELKESLVKSLLSFSYYHNLELGLAIQAKDNQIKILDSDIKQKTNLISELSNSLQAKDIRIEALDSDTKQKTSQLNEFTSSLQAKDNQIKILDSDIKQKTNLISELSNSLQAKDVRIEALDSDTKQQTNLISELSNYLQAKDARIETLDSDTKQKTSQLNELSNSLQAKDAQINNLQTQLYQIQHGILMQFRNKYQRIVEKLLRQGTRRRRYYQFGLKGIRVILNEGWRSFWFKAKRRILKIKPKEQVAKPMDQNALYQVWIARNEPGIEELAQYKQESLALSYRPKISIITPVWNTDEKWLRAAIESVKNQSYDNWELCIIDGNSTKTYIKRILNEYAQNDPRIKIKFLSENKGIAGNSNEALSLATGEFIGFLDHDDELRPHALYEMVNLLNNDSNLDLIYSDEDKLDIKGNRTDVFFKPDGLQIYSCL